MPEQPPELAFYMEKTGLPVWDYATGRYDLVSPSLFGFGPLHAPRTAMSSAVVSVESIY
jgi:hypothetical protein